MTTPLPDVRNGIVTQGAYVFFDNQPQPHTHVLGRNGECGDAAEYIHRNDFCDAAAAAIGSVRIKGKDVCWVSSPLHADAPLCRVQTPAEPVAKEIGTDMKCRNRLGTDDTGGVHFQQYQRSFDSSKLCPDLGMLTIVSKSTCEVAAAQLGWCALLIRFVPSPLHRVTFARVAVHHAMHARELCCRGAAGRRVLPQT